MITSPNKSDSNAILEFKVEFDWLGWRLADHGRNLLAA
jgi:hypothetical protein